MITCYCRSPSLQWRRGGQERCQRGEDVWCVDRMWKVDIRSTRRGFGRWWLEESSRDERSGSDIAPVMYPHYLRIK
ncbi:hypothetical protein NDU88_002857 [Pleurodeles waltl]|uniref:Uncharacterized protein n=1 Tax=Pleurodeles waltl TaxID=8319 RepID=A0AAV7UAS8_PLEWA|nr:hypothetical protein NDU88_002857 [Pleurodeles waltl]